MAKWKRDAIYSVVILVLCAVNYVLANGIDDGHIQYALASPNGYLKLWLIILELLAAALLFRSLKNRSQEETAKIWNHLAILTVAGSVLYILVVKKLGFLLTTFLLVSVLTIAYGTEVKGPKQGKAMLLQNGKFLLFSLVLTLLTQWVFQGFLSVKLPGFSLF